MPVIAVPRNAGDLTADWLTAALSEVSEGARVTDLVVIRIGGGGPVETLRLIPIWDRPTSGPSSLVAKVPAATPAPSTRTFEREEGFYRQLAPTVGLYRPRCYLSRFDAADGSYVVLLEDLSPAEAIDQLAGCTPEEAAAVMPELAALHAPRWGDPDLLGLAWMTRPDSLAARRLVADLPARHDRFVDDHAGRLDPRAVDAGRQLMDRLEEYLLDRPQPWTVTHGNLRLDNLLFGGPRVAVVDWEHVRIGPALTDVSFFVGSSLAESDRSRHEEGLVRDYHRGLADWGVATDWSDVWASYCRYAFDGMLMAIGGSGGLGDELAVTMFNRHGRQALELSSADLIRS